MSNYKQSNFTVIADMIQSIALIVGMVGVVLAATNIVHNASDSTQGIASMVGGIDRAPAVINRGN